MDANPTVVEIVVDAIAKTTALVTASAGLILIVVAGPRELRKWRRQKYAERKAEVAAASLIAAVDLLDRMEMVTTPIGLKGDPVQEKDQNYHSFMRQLYAKRLEFINPQVETFEKQRMHAHVFLTDDQNRALAKVTTHVNDVYGNILTWTTLGEGGAAYHEESMKAFMAALGAGPKDARKSIREEVTAALRTSAQFKDRD